METMTLTLFCGLRSLYQEAAGEQNIMAIYKLSTGNLLVTLTAWSPYGLAEGQVQIETDEPEYDLLEPSAQEMAPEDETAFKLLRDMQLPFVFRPWAKKRRARAGKSSRR